MQQPDESNPYEEVYKDSSTFLKVVKLAVSFFYTDSVQQDKKLTAKNLKSS